MGAQVTSVTVTYSCDVYGCVGGNPKATVNAEGMAAARKAVVDAGWAIGRGHGFERVTCPACTRRERRMITDGILDKKGRILDEARWEALYEGSK